MVYPLNMVIFQMVSIKNGDFMGFSMGFSLNEIVISWDLMVV